MATNEILNRCGLSLDAASGLKGQKKMRIFSSREDKKVSVIWTGRTMLALAQLSTTQPDPV
jgi:hypothetical protein